MGTSDIAGPLARCIAFRVRGASEARPQPEVQPAAVGTRRDDARSES